MPLLFLRNQSLRIGRAPGGCPRTTATGMLPAMPSLKAILPTGNNNGILSTQYRTGLKRYLATSKQKRKMKKQGVAIKKRGDGTTRAASEASEQQLSPKERVAKEGIWDWQEIFFLGLWPLLTCGVLVIVFPGFREMVFEANYEPMEKEGITTRPLKLPFGGGGDKNKDKASDDDKPQRQDTEASTSES